MTRKARQQTRRRKRPDRAGRTTALFDTRALLVLAIAVTAGWIAGRQAGWAAALTVGITTVTALHTILPR